MLTSTKISARFDYVLLFAGWAIVNIILFQKFGIKIVNDSPRYLSYADEIIARGVFFQTHNQWYLSYALYLALLKSIGLGVGAMVIGQVLISGVAVFCIYRSGILLSVRVAGLWAAVSFLGWVKISQWNFYVLCESLLISFTAIAFYLLLRYYKTNKGLWLTLLVLLLTFFIKPTGLWIALAGLGFILSKPGNAPILFDRISPRILFLLLIVVGLVLINQMLRTFQMIETYATGETVYDTSTAAWLSESKRLIVSPPTDLFVPPEGQPLVRLVQFIFLNPFFFAKLFFAKLFLFGLHVKPFYSTLHNIWIAATLYPSYFLAVKGIKSISEKTIRIFLLIFIALNVLSIAFTTEDWDGRFLMPLLPVIFVLAGCGASKFLNRYFEKVK